MTSVVDRYYKKITQDIDNVTMKFDISALLVKSKEHDSEIYDTENDISDNLELINTNRINISDNLELINTNKNNISDNLELINTNKENISDNLELINTNKSNISDNLNLINTNKDNISNNFELINTNRSNISDNLNLTNTNKDNISDISTKINEILKNKILQKTFTKAFTIENKEFNFIERLISLRYFQLISKMTL